MADIITADNLKEHLRITDDGDDTTIATAVAAANQSVRNTCDRTFEKVAKGSETTRVFFARSSYVCDIDDVWDVTNLEVKTDFGDDGTFETVMVNGVDFYTKPINGISHGMTGWPVQQLCSTNRQLFPTIGHRPLVQVKAAWGWSVIPDPVFQAALYVGARLFRRKDSPEGVLGGWSDMGAVRVSTKEDPDAYRLLSPFMKTGKRVLIA